MNNLLLAIIYVHVCVPVHSILCECSSVFVNKMLCCYLKMKPPNIFDESLENMDLNPNNKRKNCRLKMKKGINSEQKNEHSKKPKLLQLLKTKKS